MENLNEGKLNEEEKKLFDVTDEELESMKDINDRLVVELNTTYKLKIVSDKPKIVSIPLSPAELKQAKLDAKEGEVVPEARDARIIEVENLEDGLVYDLFITPKTLKSRIAKLYAKHEGSLANIYINMGKKNVKHELYGLIAMYWVREIENIADQVENVSDVAPAAPAEPVEPSEAML